MKYRRSAKCSRGFTLIEMVVVVSLILILISIAAPVYSRVIQRSREAVLRQDLFTMRQLISQYTLDQRKAPRSLDDLVRSHYLQPVPSNPLTNEIDWSVEEDADPIEEEPGIAGVHSSFKGISSDGTAYSTW